MWTKCEQNANKMFQQKSRQSVNRKASLIGLMKAEIKFF